MRTVYPDWRAPAPDWRAPATVGALATSRAGGVSRGAYSSLNVAHHVGDDPANVSANRAAVMSAAGVGKIQWLNQVHASDVIEAGEATLDDAPSADAAFTLQRDLALAIMTADCVPVLIADRSGTLVAAAHCGWRGAVGGVLPRLVEALPREASELVAWLGPGICGRCYEVGDDVRDAARNQGDADGHFRAGTRPGKWYFDLPGYVRAGLVDLGIGNVSGGDRCTLHDAAFFSHRRDGPTGRMVSMVWLKSRV
ncbi:MAG: peptidoglycan editing factor PgeF [Gammaproteobacteria bacterium]|nr:peptidoglycan editing factor PgeF [Gammaproteobacteria bacterium]